MAAHGGAGDGAGGLRLRQGKPGLCALTIPDPPLIHCMVPAKSGFSEARVAGAGCLKLAGMAGLERVKAPAPPLCPLLHSPTAQSPPPQTSPSIRLFHCSRQALPLGPSVPEVLGWERRVCGGGGGGGLLTDCFCPTPKLEHWEMGTGVGAGRDVGE